MKRTPALRPFPTTNAPHPEYKAVTPPVFIVCLTIETTPCFWPVQLVHALGTLEMAHLAHSRSRELCLGLDELGRIRYEPFNRSSNNTSSQRLGLCRFSAGVHRCK